VLAAAPIASDERERPRGAVLCDVAGYVGFFDANFGLRDSYKSKARVNIRTKVYIYITQSQHQCLEHHMNGIIAYIAGPKIP